ncbi:MAG: hypothetical protein V4586_20875 [Pseudomonadota bacterium]
MDRSLILPVIIKTVLPAALTAFGTVMAVLWNDGFLAFCGVH